MQVLRNRLVRVVLGLALLFTICSAYFIVSARPAFADPPNDYPSSLAPPVPKDSVIDPWRFYNRECTSFVAWRLNNNNKIPFQNYNYKVRGTHFGDAQNWGNVARSIGITVNNTPAIGAVAWWYFSSTAGHVAWVTAINSDGSVQVQDYNWGYPKNPGQFLDHKLTSAPTGYIHFKDLSNPPPTSSSPTAVSRTASTMDVFYTVNGYLVDMYWDASIGWNKQTWNLGAVGKPAAISRNGGNDLWVFYRTSSGGIGNISWNYQAGWTNGPTIASSGVTSDPDASVRDSSHVEVTWQGSGGTLMHRSWDYGAGGWLGIDTLMPDSVTGTPAIVDRNSSAIDIFVLKNNGNLVNEFWDYPNPWNRQDWTSSMIGNPAVISTSSDNMDVFYRKNIGYLEHRYWTSETGWQYEDWTAQMTTDPSVINNGNDLYVFYVETGGNVKESFRVNGTWASSNAASSGANGSFSPSAIVRASGMEVFYWGQDGTLKDARGDFTGYNWSISTISNTP